MTDGQRFTNAAYIEPGWVLVLPAGLDTAGGRRPSSRPNQPPCTSSSPARRCGRSHATSWARRRGGPRSGSTTGATTMGDGTVFDDPDLIMPGWELDVPMPTGPPSPPGPCRRPRRPGGRSDAADVATAAHHRHLRSTTTDSRAVIAPAGRRYPLPPTPTSRRRRPGVAGPDATAAPPTDADSGPAAGRRRPRRCDGDDRWPPACSGSSTRRCSPSGC